MSMDLAAIAAPGHTAIVTQELQGAVVGPNAGLAVLANEARREALPNIERLLPAARDAGVRVVHCLVQRRPDGLGANHNARIFAMSGTAVDITPGSEGATLLPEFGPAPTDVVLSRWHGVGPMGGTDLDAILRNLGVTTIVAVGVSVNIAITNLVHGRRERGIPSRRPARCGRGHPRRLRHSDHQQHAVSAGHCHHHRGSAGGLEVTDTNHETRGFPPIEPIDAPREMARFMSAMRRLQDIVVSTAPHGALWTDGVTMRGHFSRFHVGGNNAVHGGVIPLFSPFDWHFGLTSSLD